MRGQGEGVKAQGEAQGEEARVQVEVEVARVGEVVRGEEQEAVQEESTMKGPSMNNRISNLYSAAAAKVR